MQQRVLSTTHAELDAFLATHVGEVHRDDIGPWLGYAAFLRERRALDVRAPIGWQEAVNAALCADAPASARRHESVHAWRARPSRPETRPR
jgi:hypothetical protein